MYVWGWFWKLSAVGRQSFLNFWQVNIGCRHVLSVELQHQKRDYILDEHRPDHVFEDVSCFSKGSAHCFRCCKVHDVSPATVGLDIYVCGPSCKDMRH